jgi:oligopeptide transport system substrate-binding protein
MSWSKGATAAFARSIGPAASRPFHAGGTGDAAAQRCRPGAGRKSLRGGIRTMTSYRRSGLLSAVLALSVLFAVACGSSDNNKSSNATSPAGQNPNAAASPAAGGTRAAATTAAGTQAAAGNYTPAPKDQQVLVVNLGATPDFLDPHKSQFETDIAVERLLFRGLFYTDDNGNPIPAVASAIPTKDNGGISADGKTLTIKIKDGQKWSDGTPLTAKDFEYSIKRSFDPKLASPYASFDFNIVGAEDYFNALGTDKSPKNPSADELTKMRDAIGVTATDDKTLAIKLVNPQGTMPVLLGLWNMYPVKKDVVEAGGASPDNTKWATPGKLIGNGPFVLKDFKEKDHITLEANPNYTLEPKPKLQKLDIRLVEDEESAYNAFTTGELAMVSIPTSKVPLVDGDPNLKKQNVRGPVPRTGGIEFNFTVKPLDNKNVRLAIAKAIDRDAFVKVTRAGVATPTQCWIAPGTPGYDKSDCDVLKFDVAAAKKLLADGGYPNGQGFPELSLVITNSPVNKAIAEFLQKQLKDNLNINIKLDLVDSKTRSSRYSNSQFELFYGGWQEDYHDPENWLPELWHTGGGNNQYKYSNKAVDDLLDQAKFETDNTKRVSLYRQAHKLLIEDGNGAWIENNIRNWLVNPKVRNVTPNAQDSGWVGQFDIEKIEIAK